jgi:hypothetical protein
MGESPVTAHPRQAAVAGCMEEIGFDVNGVGDVADVTEGEKWGRD